MVSPRTGREVSAVRAEGRRVRSWEKGRQTAGGRSFRCVSVQAWALNGKQDGSH